MLRSTRSAPIQQRAIETRATALEGAARVFARLPYSEARLKDIALESGVSEGAIYAHYGSKADVAKEILAAQQERMSAVLAKITYGNGTGLSKIIDVARGLAELIATDVIVQAGTKLSTEPSRELPPDEAHDPYFEWVSIARALVEQGIDDGSIRADEDPQAAAEFINALFVGGQVLSGFQDSWASLPTRMSSLENYITRVLGATGSEG